VTTNFVTAAVRLLCRWRVARPASVQLCAAKAIAPAANLQPEPAGGFGAEYTDDGKPCGSSIGYIGGVKCCADEARLGGSVIQLVA
jgi:hypothetical protein